MRKGSPGLRPAPAGGPRGRGGARPRPGDPGRAGDGRAGNAEMEARLEVRTAEERLRAIAGRADALVAAARHGAAGCAARLPPGGSSVSARRWWPAARGRGRRATRLARPGRLAGRRQRAGGRRPSRPARGRGGGAEGSARPGPRPLATEFDRVVDAAHGTELARAEQPDAGWSRWRPGAAEEFAVSAEETRGRVRPGRPGPPSSAPDSPSPAPAAERSADGRSLR